MLTIIVSFLVVDGLPAVAQNSPPPHQQAADQDDAAVIVGRWYGIHTVSAATYHHRIDVRREGEGLVGDGLAWFAMSENQADTIAGGQTLDGSKVLDCATCIRLQYQVELSKNTLTFRCTNAQTLYQAWTEAARDPLKRAGYRMPHLSLPAGMPPYALAEAVMRWPAQNNYHPDAFSSTLIAPGVVGGRADGDGVEKGLFRLWKHEALSAPLPLTLQRGHSYVLSCLGGSAYHYTCYLPRSYTPAKPSPVLFYMAPRGNAQPLSTTMAERLGWIMVGFTEARDGPWPPICENRDAVLFDLRRRFNIASHGLYFAGFSGGARASILSAVSYPDDSAGLFCIGAGMPGENRMPVLSIPIYFSAGEMDYNKNEVMELYERERKLGRTTAFRLHSGGHSYGHISDHISAISWLAAITGIKH